jgi:Coenzyme F390 synthetase
MIVNSEQRLELLRTARREFERGDAVDPAFYRRKIADVWARAQASPAYAKLGDFSWDTFRALPVTTKEQLKRDPWSYVAAPVEAAAKYYETTGTTGTATPTPRLAEDIIWNTVSVARAWGDLVGTGDRVLSLLPSDVVPVGDLVAGVCEYLDVPHTRAYPFATGICDWDRLAEVWAALRPTVVFLAPGVALQATRLFKQRGRLAELRSSVRALMLLGEVSVPALRARLGHWWGATAYDASYGSTETGTLAATCPRDRLHLLTVANYVELAGDTGAEPLGDRGAGRLVVTPLNLYARPLLRYDTGDEVEVTSGCDCGRATPVVTVLGRATDGLRIQDTALTPHLVEQIVYGATTATGYLLETDPAGRRFRLLLERDVDADRSGEPAAAEAVRAAFRDHGLDCAAVLFLNSLPSTTKSGGSQKSWKRSNIRIVTDRSVEDW